MPMQPQFSTVTLASLHLWLDNYLTQKGQAYTNVTTPLYYAPDSRRPGYVSYQSPFRAWVGDSGVSGASIIGKVSGNFGTLNRGQSGVIFDFENGRVLFPTAFGTTNTVSGTYAFKDFNIYKANETAERMVFSQKYYLNSRFGNPITGVPPPYDMVTPCIFISDVARDNQPWALGGLYNTTQHFTLNILAENLTQLEGALSLLADAKDVNFPLLGLSYWPYATFGDYKSGYNYAAYQAQFGTPGNLMWIEDAKASKVGDGTPIDQSVFLGVVDLAVSRPRTIH